MASAIRKDDANAQVSANSLVNEAWLKLKNSRDLEFKSPLHFKLVAARAMRQILLDAARRRVALKRGGENNPNLAASEDEIAGPIPGERELMALRNSLDELSALNPRQGFLVKSRYFGGLAMSEIAALLQVSESTVLREWRSARAWLGTKIRSGSRSS
jgi:RNA polymerase sigma factor (TIGR02999 family)